MGLLSRSKLPLERAFFYRLIQIMWICGCMVLGLYSHRPDPVLGIYGTIFGIFSFCAYDRGFVLANPVHVFIPPKASILFPKKMRHRDCMHLFLTTVPIGMMMGFLPPNNLAKATLH